MGDAARAAVQFGDGQRERDSGRGYTGGREMERELLQDPYRRWSWPRAEAPMATLHTPEYLTGVDAVIALGVAWSYTLPKLTEARN